VTRELEIVGGEKGTEVVVEQLFANVPARLKFLKSDAAEISQIKQVLKALALAHHQIEFRLRYRGEMVYYWPAQSARKERVIQVLEQSEIYEIQGERDGIKVEVAFAPPHKTVRTSRQIWVFVQGRWVQDRRIQTAVTEAYRSLLMHGEFPVAIVWMTCDPQDIDVNIHPTKSQVKFRDDKSAFRSVHQTLRKGLESAPWVQSLLGDGLEARERARGFDFSEVVSEASRDYEPIGLSADLLASPATSYSNLTFENESLDRIQYQKKTMAMREDIQDKVLPLTFQTHLPSRHGVEGPPFSNVDKVSGESQHNGHEEVFVPLWSHLQVLGQADQTYILAQSGRALILVDQHAAHERVVYERLMKSWGDGKMDVQDLLLPIQLEMDEEVIEGVISLAESLERMGVSVDRAGPNLVNIRSLPSFIKESALTRALQNLGQEVISQGDSFAFEKAVSEIFATMACHSVVRAGQALSEREMKSLLEQMDEFPLSSFCPHGRPVFIEYSFSQIQRDFGRLV
jgi:DNA mismatch repair protein MutL